MLHTVPEGEELYTMARLFTTQCPNSSTQVKIGNYYVGYIINHPIKNQYYPLDDHMMMRYGLDKQRLEQQLNNTQPVNPGEL